MIKRFFVVGFLLLLMGCQFNDSDNPAASEGVKRDDAIYLVGSQPRTLDPAKTHGGAGGVLGHVFSGLTVLDTDLQVQPDLAAGWEISEDGLTYTFYLHKAAVFHNGRSVTAEDVIFSWERAAHPDTGSDTVQANLGDIVGVQEMINGEVEEIRGLRALDSHTLQVQLITPTITFLAKLTQPVAFVVDKENVVNVDWEHSPNGTGPFRLQRWRDDDLIVLARHENTHQTPAHVSHVVYLLGPGLSLARYETDAVDLVGIGGDALDRTLDPNNPLSADLRTIATMCTSFIGLNNRLAPFDDVRVRQAFNYALDRERLIDIFWNGKAIPAKGALPPGVPGFDVENMGYPFDPVKAKQLLAEAGYADPTAIPTLTYYTSGYGDASDYVTAVITLWQEALGVTIQPVLIDPYTYLDELYGGNIGHIFATGWCVDYPDPENVLDVLFHSESQQNLSGFENEAVDSWLQQARSETNTQQRLSLYQQVEDTIVVEAPVVFVAHGLTAVLVKPHIQNYHLVPISLPQWHLVKRP